MIKKIPYLSQWDSTASESRDDCGPACIAMILNGDGLNTTVDEVYKRTGAGPNYYINFQQMFKAISSYGYTYSYVQGRTLNDLKGYINSGKTPIALIHYGYLSNRQDQGFSGPHFIDIVGYDDDYIYANDPDYWEPRRSEGDTKAYKINEFMNAWSNASLDGNPNNSLIVIDPKNTQPMPEPIPDNIKRKSSFYDVVVKNVTEFFGQNFNSDNVTEKQNNDFIAWIKSNVSRAGKWDQLCVKAYGQVDSSKVTVDQLYAKIQSQTPQPNLDQVKKDAYNLAVSDADKAVLKLKK